MRSTNLLLLLLLLLLHVVADAVLKRFLEYSTTFLAKYLFGSDVLITRRPLASINQSNLFVKHTEVC